MPRINELGQPEVAKNQPLQETKKKEETGRTATGFSVNVAPPNRALAALLLAFNVNRAAAQNSPSGFATSQQWYDTTVGFSCALALGAVFLVLLSACFYTVNARRLNRLEDQRELVNRRLERLELEAVAARTATTIPIPPENPPAYADLPPPAAPVPGPEVQQLLDLQRRLQEFSEEATILENQIDAEIALQDDRSSIDSLDSYFDYEEIEQTTPM